MTSTKNDRTGQLHHLEIFVDDLARTIELWSWLLGELGYRKLEEWEGGLSFKRGPTFLAFVEVADKYREPSYHRKRVGLNHLAFHGRSREHVDAIRDGVEAHGGRLLYSDRYPYAGGDGYYAVFFEDPSRIKVEVVAPRERPAKE